MRTLAEEKQHFSIVIVIPTVGTRLALGHEEQLPQWIEESLQF